MIKRRIFFGFAIPFAIAAHSVVFGQERFVEGRHYVEVSPRQPTKDKSQIEVLEFFAYSCSHCSAFEPTLESWLEKLPPTILFRRIPIAFREDFVIHQKLYFALETLGLVDQLHGKVFNAIHVEKQPLATNAEIISFAAKNGVDGKRLLDAMNSFSVAGKVRAATTLANGYKIEGTPSMGVNGRWITSGSQAGSNLRALTVTEQLIELEKKGG